LTGCSPCGPDSCQGAANIVQGYEKTYFFSLFYQDAGTPYDLTGALQIIASHPGTSGTPVNEYYAVQEILATTGNTAASSNQLNNLASVVGLIEGLVIVGTGIPSGTTIVSVGTNFVTMSANATSTNTGENVTFNTPTNVTIVGAPGAGLCQVVCPAFDTAAMMVNPTPTQNQNLQVSVTNANGTITAFVIPFVLNISAPPYGVV